MGWLESTADNIIVMPDVNITHYDNKTVFIRENETSEEEGLIKDTLLDALLVVIGVPSMILLFIAALFLSIGEVYNWRCSREEITTVVTPRKGQDAGKEAIINNIESMKRARGIFDQQFAGRSQIYGIRRPQKALGGPGPLLPGGFRSAPPMNEVKDLAPEPIEVEWDEDVDEDIEEWEEVEI